MPTVSKFTAETREVVIEALREGCSRNVAAGLAGITPSTLSDWVKKGTERDKESRYREFAEEVLVAEAQFLGRAAKIIHRAASDDPKWAAWVLERRDPAYAPPRARAEAGSDKPQVILLTLEDGRVAQPALVSVPNEAESA